MDTVSTFMIEGMIRPPSVSCAAESNLSSTPRLTSKVDEVVLEDLKYLYDHYETFVASSQKFFWKERMIVALGATSTLISMTFLPVDFQKQQVLFVQKERKETTTGFIAPYLSERSREKWEAVETPSLCHTIADEETASASLEGLEGTVHEEVQTVLSYFLKDPTTQFLGLTYRDQDNRCVTRGWTKISSIKSGKTEV